MAPGLRSAIRCTWELLDERERALDHGKFLADKLAAARFGSIARGRDFSGLPAGDQWWLAHRRRRERDTTGAAELVRLGAHLVRAGSDAAILSFSLQRFLAGASAVGRRDNR